jgi:Polyketide cyclase / dehydrase and lipid transport
MIVLAAASTVEIPGVSPQEVLEFVLDLERYKHADHKIVKVGLVTGPDESGRGSVKLSGRLRYGPAAPDLQHFDLNRWSRLTFMGASGQMARAVFNFTGTFECTPTESGTGVTHAYVFQFRGPFRLLEPLHRGWLQTELDDEMERVRETLAK